MKRFLKTDGPFVILLTLLSFYYFWGIKFVPFHPDESTYIYMSSDFDALFNDVSSLFWQADREDDARQNYRELDAPITRYLIGLGRTLSGHQALPVDWDWGKSWDENISAGAYPDSDLLSVSRLSIALFLPLTLTLMYSIGKHIQGRSLGLLSALLLGTNAVVLLHGRRAMTEGPLLLGVTLAAWSFLHARKNPWLVGFALAVAFNAKHLALALVPVGILAIIWSPKTRYIKIGMNLLKFMSSFMFITVALNPLHWNHPMQSIAASIEARQELVDRQIEGLVRVAPERYLDTPAQRLLMMVANIFIGPAEHSLVSNLVDTQEDVDTYIAMPGHNTFRGLVWGGVFIILTIVGLYVAMRSLQGQKTHERPEIAILLMAAFFQWAAIMAVPLPWVRFSIPLLPFVCLFTGYGLLPFVKRGKSKELS